MSPIFGLTVYLSEQAALPVQLQDASGNELTGYTAAGVSVLTSLNGAALAPYVPASGDLVKLGHGLYELTMPPAQVNAEGPFVYRVATNDALAVPFNGFAQVQHRTDQYVCHISPVYNEVTLDLGAMVWLTLNGAVVINPVSCQIRFKDINNVTVFNATSITPNADGVFMIQASAVVLALDSDFECLIQVTDSAGGIHTSVEGAISFN